MSIVSKKLQAPSVTGGTDPNFNKVSLLLHGDGTNGAQNNTFVDSSSNNFTITRNGNTTQGTFSPYGSLWSNYFDGSGDYLTVASNAAFALGTGDFTFECFTFQTTSGANQNIYTTNVTNGLIVYLLSGKVVVRSFGVSNLITSSADLPINQWAHIALSRTGTTLSLFINGSRANGGTVTNSTNFAQGQVIIGANESAASLFTGYASNLRLVKGSAVYDPTQSTITVPTNPLTAVSGTSLLTCQSNRFIDNSSNNFAITVNGNTSVQRFSPFNPTAAYSASTLGGSGYFDGTGDYLTIPANSAFQPGTGDFSLECWFNCQTTAVAGLIGTNYTGASPNTYILITLNRDAYGNNVPGYVGGALVDSILAIGASSSVFSNSTWNHVVFCRTGTTLSLFLNGTRIGTTTNSTNIVPNIQFEIGNTSSLNRQFTGYISNARMIKGSNPYNAASSTITVPTAPLTAITNTSLLCNFTNAGIPDAAMMNDLETVGNAQVSTSVKKYGTGSLYFDGSGDYLKFISTPNTEFGIGDFTIEGWIYSNNISSTQLIIERRASFDARGIAIFIEASKISFRAGDTNISAWEVVIDSGTLSSNTWYHFAFTRSGTTWRGFVNGTQVGSSITWSGTLSDETSNWLIGIAFNGSVGLNGYIDDLRITKGLARYTANFTPPTQAFPDQ